MSSRTPRLLARATSFIERDVWRPLETARRRTLIGQRALQGLIAVAAELRQDLILLRASALTYYTVLSLVPLLAVVAAISAAVGVRDLLPRLVSPIEQVSPDMAARIVGFVRTFDFGSLGTVGAAMLFATTLLGISSIERALNAVWGVERVRSWARRIPDYLAVLVIAPILLGVAVPLGGMLATAAEDHTLLRTALLTLASWAGPILLYWLGFSALFWFMPNTHVRARAALLGGAVTAVLFVVASQLYVDLQVGVARANAMFGGLAAFPITVVWIYLSWVVVLLGAECAYVHQNFAQLRNARTASLPAPAAREAIGLAVAVRVAERFTLAGEAISTDALAGELGVHERAVRQVVRDLEAAGILALRGDPQADTYQLGRAPDRVCLRDVLTALRGPREPEASLGEVRETVMSALAELDAEGEAILAKRTLADLVASKQSAAGASGSLDA